MNIKEYYSQEILRLLLKKYTLGGYIPSPQELEAQFIAFQNEYPNLGNRTLIAQRGDFVKPRSEVKLEDFQSFVIASKLDTKILRQIVIDSYQKFLSIIANWRVFFASTEARLVALNDELTNLLLLQSESEGYIDFYKEDFFNLDKVNVTNSTAEILTDVGLVKISELATRSYNHKISDIALDASFAGTINKEPTTLNTVTGTNINNILREEDEGWIVNAFSRTAGKAELIINIRLKETTEINRIVYRRLRRDLSRGTLECFYSSDRINWSQFGRANSISETGIFINEPVQIKEIRFILKKDDYDAFRPDSGYTYSFDCKEIEFFKDKTDYTQGGGIFISNALEFPAFNKVALESCDINTKDTNVKYYVSTDNINYFEINPSNKEPSSVPYVISFSGSSEKSNATITNIDSLIDPNKGSTELVLNYNKIVIPSQSVALINHKITPLDIANNNIPWASVRIFKDWTKGLSVDKISGWEFNEDGNRMSTTFYFSGIEPMVLDFGSNPIILNGLTKVGRVTLSERGWYRLEIDPSSYSFVTQGLTSLALLQREDPLYPYNVKHIIEGYEYSSDFSGPKKYFGFPQRAAKELSRANSINDFLSNIENKFYIGLDEDGSALFMVKRPDNIDDIMGHKYLVSYNRTETLYNNLYVRMELYTENSDVTPFVSSYTVKVGH